MFFNNNSHYESLREYTINNKVYDDYKKTIKHITKENHFKIMLNNATNSIKYYNKKKHLVASQLKTHKLNVATGIGIPNSDIYSYFMSPTIKTIIRKTLTDHHTIVTTFVIKNENTTVHATLVENPLLENIDAIQLYGFITILTDFFTKYITDTERTHNIKLCVFPTNEKKTFNIDFETSLDSSNINSGFTRQYADGMSYNDKTIIIYRKEECYKVIVHELIHAFAMDLGALCDIKDPGNKKVIKTIQSHFNIDKSYNNGDFKIEETYCEFWTIFIYTLFYSIERTPKNTKNKNKTTLTRFIERYSSEYVYNIINTINLINYHTMFHDILENKVVILTSSLGVLIKSIPLSINDGTMALFNRKTRQTNTSLMEYVPLKMIMMTNITRLFNLRRKYDNVFNVQCSQTEINEILLFLSNSINKNISKTKRDYDRMLSLVDFIDKNAEYKKKPFYTSFHKSLCMTMFS